MKLALLLTLFGAVSFGNDHAPAPAKKEEHGKPAAAKKEDPPKKDEHAPKPAAAKVDEHAKKDEHGKKDEKKKEEQPKDSHAAPAKKPPPVPPKEEHAATKPKATPKPPARRPSKPIVARASRKISSPGERIVLNWDRPTEVKWEPAPDSRSVRVEWQTAQR